MISSLFLRDMGVRLEYVGLTSLFGLPWILKFLWGPLVDKFCTKRSWLLSMQFLLLCMMLIASLVAPLKSGPALIAILFFIGSFFAATHDTAIDGFYMEILDEKMQTKFIGYRVMAYRIALMTGTGAVATVGTTMGWFFAFISAAIIFGLFFIYHYFWLPATETEEYSIKALVKTLGNLKIVFGALALSAIIILVRSFYQSSQYQSIKEQFPILKKIWFSHWIAILLFSTLLLVLMFRKKINAYIMRNPDSFYSKAFISFIDRKKIGVIFASIIFLRTGEFMLSGMVAPFFVDLGIKIHYGWISSFVGLPFSIVGALLGGWMISKFTLKKVLWPFLLLQNLTNVVYMILALFLAKYIAINTGAEHIQSIGEFNLFLVASVQGFDQFAGGLGTSVLMTFLMRLCSKEYKAAHYAIGTGFMSISGVFTGVLGGFLCSYFGYGYFFGISFIFSIPGMVAIMFLPNDILKNNTAK